MLPPPPSGDIMIGPDGKRVAPPTTGALQDRWDAILYLGKRSELTRVEPPGGDILTGKWLAEIARRRKVLGGPASDQQRPADSREYFPDAVR
jgi:hypothetical protein